MVVANILEMLHDFVRPRDSLKVPRPNPAMRVAIAPLVSLARVLGALVLMVAAGGRLVGQQPPSDSSSLPTVKVETNLVSLTATVVDRDGKPVPNLNKEDFTLYEDGIRQGIAIFQREDNPVSVGILFDTSGSMVDKIDDVKDAVVHFTNIVNPQDEFFLLQFSTEAFVVQDLISDREELRKAVGRLRARGSTALYEAIAKGSTYVRQGRHRKKALLVITDGNDTSSEISFQEVIRLTQISEVLIYCLGIGHGERGSFAHIEGTFEDTVNIDALRAISDATGGRAFLLEGPHTKGGVDQIDQACQQVAAELRQQYVLGYYPTNTKKDGTFRHIRAEVKGSGFRARTREGYFAPRAQSATPDAP